MKTRVTKDLFATLKEFKNKDEKSRLIIEKVINDPWYKEAKVIAIYKSLFSELKRT